MTTRTAIAPDAVVATDLLTRRFGQRRGITDVTFTVTRGEVFGFLGPNGAGKSTTIRLLLGLYRPTSGHATVFGLDPRRDGVQARRQLGYLPGDLALFPRLTGRAILNRAAHIRGHTDHRYRDELIDRFAAEIDRPVHTLSKGNVQKIGLILAFAHRPELLVLDEPTSRLDPLLQDEFTRLVRETTADGRTVSLSSHDLDEVQRLVERLAIIKERRIIVTDTVEHLRASSPTTVELRFRPPVDPTSFQRMAVRVLSHDTTRPLRIALLLRGRRQPTPTRTTTLLGSRPGRHHVGLCRHRGRRLQPPRRALNTLLNRSMTTYTQNKMA